MANTSFQVTVKKFEKWCHLVVFIEEEGKLICRNILHGRMHVPEEGAEIYKYLQHYKSEIRKCHLPCYAENILLSNDEILDRSKLDLSLYTYIIQILDKAKKYPLIKELRYKRNQLFHMGASRDMSEQEFKEHWDEVSQLLKDLNDGMEFSNKLKPDAHFLSEEHEMALKVILKDIEGR